MCLGQPEMQCGIIRRRFSRARQRQSNVRNTLEPSIDVCHPHPQVGSAGLKLFMKQGATGRVSGVGALLAMLAAYARAHPALP